MAEYTYQSFDGSLPNPPISNLDYLNHLGKEGWELCGIDRTTFLGTSRTIFYLKKRIPTWWEKLFW